MEKSFRSQLENWKSESNPKSVLTLFEKKKKKKRKPFNPPGDYKKNENERLLEVFNEYSTKSFPTTLRKNLRKNEGTNVLSVINKISEKSLEFNYHSNKMNPEKLNPGKHLLKVASKEEMEMEFERDLAIKEKIAYFEKFGKVKEEIKAKKEKSFDGRTIEEKILTRRKR